MNKSFNQCGLYHLFLEETDDFELYELHAKDTNSINGYTIFRKNKNTGKRKFYKSLYSKDKAVDALHKAIVHENKVGIKIV